MTTPPPAILPYELRIGVTGHCELEDPAELEAAVAAAVRRHVVAVLEGAAAEPFGRHGAAPKPGDALFRAMTAVLAPVSRLLARVVPAPVVPHAARTVPAERRTPVDLTVITSLAPGSDQIVSRAIRSCIRDGESRNRTLEAVLPFPASLYAEELPTPEERAAFEALLRLDRGRGGTHPEPTVVHPDFANARDPEQPDAPLPRWKAFRDAGRHVVDASEILLAVWDPTRDARPGGTEDTVRHAVDRGRVVLWLDPSDLARGLRRLRRREEDDPAPGQAGLEGLVATALPSRAKELSHHFHRLAAFNRDAAWDARLYRRSLGDATARLARAGAKAGLPQEAAELIRREVLPHYAHADHLSLRYHALRNFVMILLPALSALAVTFISFQILFLPALYPLAAVELAMIFAGYLSYRLSVRDAWHEKWLNDRHLAERCRGLAYTALVLDPEDGDGKAEDESNLLPFYRPTNAWFSGTLARVAGRVRRMRPPGFDPAEHAAGLAHLVRRGWIESEAEHHAAVAARERAAEQRSRRFTELLLAGIVLVAGLHALGVGHGHAEATSPLLRIDLWVALLTICIPAWGAAYQAIDSWSDHPRLRERSARMAEELRGLAERLETTATHPDLCARVREALRIIELEGQDHAESLRAKVPSFHG